MSNWFAKTLVTAVITFLITYKLLLLYSVIKMTLHPQVAPARLCYWAFPLGSQVE